MFCVKNKRMSVWVMVWVSGEQDKKLQDSRNLTATISGSCRLPIIFSCAHRSLPTAPKTATISSLFSSFSFSLSSLLPSLHPSLPSSPVPFPFPFPFPPLPSFFSPFLPHPPPLLPPFLLFLPFIFLPSRKGVIHNLPILYIPKPSYSSVLSYFAQAKMFFTQQPMLNLLNWKSLHLLPLYHFPSHPGVPSFLKW